MTANPSNAVASTGGNGDAPRRGRPTKFGDEIAKKLCQYVAHGVPYTWAARLGGISYQTFLDWQRKYAGFAEQLEAARASAIAHRLGVISKAIDAGDVRAAMWWLEHVFPEHFARNRIEVTGANGGPLAGGVAIYLPQKKGQPLEANPPPTEVLADAEDGDDDSQLTE